MTSKIPAPETAQAVWAEINSRRPVNFTANPGLVFERYLGYDFKDDDRSVTMGSDAKTANFNRVIEMTQSADPALLAAWNRRWKQVVRAAGAESFTASTDWRFLPGFGRKGGLEVGFSFHRYGFAYLPGSAVKGIARTAAVAVLSARLGASSLKKLDDALNACGDESERMMVDLQEAYKEEPLHLNENNEELVRAFHLIFGSQARAGRAVFFSAIPAALENGRLPAIERDILTSHFPDYYSEKVLYPTDSQNPNPVAFITVAAGVKFLFAVGWRGIVADAQRDQARQWLELGLEKIGAGAKTGVGYGYFRDFTGVTVEAERPKTDTRGENQPPPPPPVETAIHYAVVMRNQNNPGMIAARDEQSEHIWMIPTRLFGGRAPAGKSRLRLEVRGDEVVKAEKL